MTPYEQFLAKKAIVDAPSGIDNPRGISKSLFEWQQPIVKWALQRGMERNFIGFELKESYYKQACANLKIAEDKLRESLLL